MAAAIEKILAARGPERFSDSGRDRGLESGKTVGWKIRV